MTLVPPQRFRKTEGIHRIGLASQRPLPADVLVGTLYFSTDTSVLERSNGTTWVPYAGAGGGGSLPTDALGKALISQGVGVPAIFSNVVSLVGAGSELILQGNQPDFWTRIFPTNFGGLIFKRGGSGGSPPTGMVMSSNLADGIPQVVFNPDDTTALLTFSGGSGIIFNSTGSVITPIYMGRGIGIEGGAKVEIWIKNGQTEIPFALLDTLGTIKKFWIMPDGLVNAPTGIISPFLDITETVGITSPLVDTARMYSLDVNGYTQVEMKDSIGRGVRFASDNVLIAKIIEPVGMARGQIVYIAGAAGANALIRLAQSNNIATMPVIGMVMDTGANNAFTRVLTSGTLQGINTSAFAEGVSLFVSPTTPGALTDVLPIFPNYAQRVGFVTRSHATQGEILILTTGTVTDPRLHAPTHAVGGTDPVTLAQSQVTNLTTDLAGKAALIHAPTHSDLGTDPVTITNLAGFPGGTTAFLRADKTFAVPSGGSSDAPELQDFRLSLVSGNPIFPTDVINASTLYLTPSTGNRISLYNGSIFQPFSTGEISTAFPGSPGLVCDVFCFDSGGTPALTFAGWATDTARAQAIVRLGGVWVNAANTGQRYIGTIRTTNAGQCTDAYANRSVWNNDNRALRALRKVEILVSDWTYSVSAWRVANGNANNCVQWVMGLDQEPIVLAVAGAAANTGSGTLIGLSIGLDAVTPGQFTQNPAFYSPSTPGVFLNNTSSMNDFLFDGGGTRLVQIGFHTANWIEYSGGGTTTFAGSAVHAGLMGYLKG